ncbi:MAG TPA: fructose bisphosphate aldolase [Acidimicrobiales bacterium]|nr:fructose bisphosphate aldolase [Acidimicrobiales bacterium]
MNTDQSEKVRSGQGFLAALDQSGGSTPKALKLYGIEESEYSGEAEMFDRIHEMRSRIIKSPAFTGERVVGAILFEQTMDREIDGQPTGDYLWKVKGVVPFLKIDKGLQDEAQGVQLMKPMPDLDALLERGVKKGMFGTKERSVIKLADPAGVQAVVDQQFEVGRQVLAHGLVPILEPEVDIKSPQKAEAEALLRAALLAGLESVPDGQQVMFKLTLPEEDDFYEELVEHPKVLKVVALSGGYSREEANAKLARNHGVIASFSRALTEGLSAQQSDEEFDHLLDQAVKSIYEASIT